MEVINNFGGMHGWLSNFHKVEVVLDGVTYKSTEHAYQAAKTLDPWERAIIWGVEQPGAAKRLGYLVTLRPDWETVKAPVMYDVLKQKFATPFLKHQLLATKVRT